jgi:cellulase/cellobiase CelA1
MDLKGEAPADLRGKGCQDVTLSAPSSAPAVRNRAANVQPAKSPKAISKNGKAPLADLGLARNVWNSAMEKVRSAYGANEFKKYRFRDVTVVSADEDGAGIIHLTLRTPAPEKAEMGIAKHETVISQALCGYYGRTVKLRVIRD